MTTALSITCLLLVTLVCLLGVFSQSFRDNWPQFLGLVLTSIWTSSELFWLCSGFSPARSDLIVYLGLSLYATGTAFKVFQNRKLTQGEHIRAQSPLA